MNKSKLMPCPFCGGEAYHYAPGPIEHHIACKNYKECGADIERDTEAEAIKAWNKRVKRYPESLAQRMIADFSDAFVAMPTDEIKTKIMLSKIVRCEDCANSSFDEFGVGWCSENCREVKPCDYCVWGERK